MDVGRGFGIVSNTIDQVLMRLVSEFLGTVSELTPGCFGQETLVVCKSVFGIICLYGRDECGVRRIVRGGIPRRGISLPTRAAHNSFPGRGYSRTFSDPNGTTRVSPHMLGQRAFQMIAMTCPDQRYGSVSFPS